MLWKLLGELELDLMVEGETQVLLLPGFTLAEVILVNIHIVFIYKKSLKHAVYRYRSGRYGTFVGYRYLVPIKSRSFQEA